MYNTAGMFHLLILFSTVFENIQAVQESPGQDFKVVEFHWSPWWYLTQNRPCCIWRNGKVTQKKYHTRSVLHCQSYKVMNRAMRKPFCRKKYLKMVFWFFFFKFNFCFVWRLLRQLKVGPRHWKASTREMTWTKLVMSWMTSVRYIHSNHGNSGHYCSKNSVLSHCML